MRFSRSSFEMDHAKFRKLLKRWREAKGFTQQDAAKHLGVSLRTLQNWEIARNMPRGFGLKALVELLSSKR
jgi:transcriptional regulator with XRE-family HTH domain